MVVLLLRIASSNKSRFPSVPGRVWVSRGSLFQNGSNLVYSFRGLSRSATHLKSRASEISRLSPLWKPERKRLASAVGLLFVSSLVTMSVPFALGKIIDTIYLIDQDKDNQNGKKQFEKRLQTFCGILVGIFLIGGACNFGRVYLMRIAAQNITARIRNLLYSSTMKKNVTFFDKNKTGELVNRLSADTQLVSQTITQQVSDGLRSAVMTSAGVGMMVFMSPHLAMVGLGIVPPVAAWAVITGKKVKAASRQVQDSLAEATELAEEKLSNIRTVNAFAKQVEEVRNYQKKMSSVLDISSKEAWIHAKFYGMTGLSGNLIIVSVLYYGGSLVTTDVITVGNLASFVLYAGYVGIGLNGMSSAYAEVMKGLGASSRIFEIVENKEADEQETVEEKTKTDLAQNIQFRNIHFRYPTRQDVKVFDGLDMIVPAKKITAVVGSSGSGKSTLASLLLKFYHPEEGLIQIGAQNLAEINTHELRQKVGIVTQEPVLFSSSIKDNILYGCDEMMMEEVGQKLVEEAAKEANAHDFIQAFPEGYQTLVGERGILLSGGQKQRIAIARAIIKNPEILLLDEATSALDASSEHQVKEALLRVMKGRTVITIAHRLSTIINADKIVVLQDGKIAEEGTFDQLNSMTNGIFKQLVTKQTINQKL